MRRIALTLLVLIFFPAMVRGDLLGDIRAITTEAELGQASCSVSIVKLGATRQEDQVLIDLQSRAPMMPASNLKVLTTSLAIDRLGADFRFRTLLVSRGDELAIIGDGDPTLGDAEHLKEHGWDSTTLFQQWAGRLKALELKRVKTLRVDDGIFESQTLNPNWPADQIGLPYVAEISGLNLNANCLDVYVGLKGDSTIASFRPASAWISMKNATTIGSEQSIWLDRKPEENDVVVRGTVTGANSAPYRVTVHDPAMFAGNALAGVLRRNGINVENVTRDRSVRPEMFERKGGWEILETFETDIQSVIRIANKESNNLYAEALFKRSVASRDFEGSWTRGDEVMRAYLAGLGVEVSDIKLDDGSGLSRNNRVTASAITTVLAHRHHDLANADAYKQSLAIAGIDGTLDRRFDSNLKGRVFAKTGYIRGVSCLSGYLQTRSGDWYAFSLLFNELREDKIRTAKAAQEEIVSALDKSSR